MRVKFNIPEPSTSESLFKHLGDLLVEGLSGWSKDLYLYAEFPDREELTEAEAQILAVHVAAYVHASTWTEVRTVLRPPLLAEADVRINHAEDNGEDTMALRAYRQALRTITDTPNTPDNFTWPTKPWKI